MEPHHSSIGNTSATVPPELPRELERLIFELAACNAGPKASTTLLLVAKRVHNWIRPLIYRVFNQITIPPLPDLRRSGPQLLENIGHLVEKLLVGYNTESQYPLEKFLSFCPNIVDLATWHTRISHLLPTIDKLPLRRLSANFDDFIYEDFLTRSFFTKITHLDLLLFMGESWDKQFEALTHLPELTHLAIGFPVRVAIISQLLCRCRLLQILMLTPADPDQYFYDMIEERFVEIHDHRLVLLETPNFPGLVYDWEQGARGGMACWVFSELVSLAKRQNYFVTHSPLCFPRVGFAWEKHLNREGLEWFTGLHLDDPWPVTETW
ncbi:hypothetical protein M413DRAFT_447009 [Hebeloma cylindrosporum]|uniref:Uncharacterized protein n=1 Tax=Hebeloma cylindrosporum TaxID=76867 RepID=A0A0C2YEQ6_HEBCY|nr:hypothetical protein M413DRAFT_447009 [Hebeloma cylindrosporum h7]